MAIAYRSVATTALASRNGAAWSITIAKPTGLTAGDYMVAIIGTSLNSATQAVSGWTSLGTQLNGQDTRITVYGKVADSADAAATDFTFAVHSGSGGTADAMGGVLIAISGTAPITTTSFVDFGTSAGTAQTYTGGITPLIADSLLIMGTWGQGSVISSVSNYAITTDNPTWTERFDDTETVDTNDYTMGVATAPRSAVTATGNFTLDYADSYDTAGVLIAVLETTNVTASPAVIVATASVQAPVVSAGAIVTVSATLVATVTVQAPTVAVGTPDWSNTSKTSAPSVSNTSKTAAPTWENTAKTSAPTWVNTDKT